MGGICDSAEGVRKICVCKQQAETSLETRESETSASSLVTLIVAKTTSQVKI